MEPMPPTPGNQFMATCLGIATGVGAQILFQYIVNTLIGPVPDGINGKLIAWTALLLAPPLLSYMFIRISPGSVSESFFKGFQLGSIIWLLVAILAIFGVKLG